MNGLVLECNEAKCAAFAYAISYCMTVSVTVILASIVIQTPPPHPNLPV